MQALGHRRRRSLAPQLVDQALGGDDLIGVQQQHCQQSAALAGTDRHRPLAVGHFEWTEQLELHAGLLRANVTQA